MQHGEEYLQVELEHVVVVNLPCAYTLNNLVSSKSM